MYTGRQQKEPTSRVIGQPMGKGVQQLRVRDNRTRTVKQGKLIQAKPSGLEIAGGVSSILGGLITTIIGCRDIHNARKDSEHFVCEVSGRNLTINGASGTLERINDDNSNNYKVKVQGTVDGINGDTDNTDKDSLHTKNRRAEGAFNFVSGALNIGAGIATIAGGPIHAAVMYGLGTLATAGAAGSRWWRSRKV